MFALGVLGLSTTAIAMPPRENVSREHPEKIDPWLQTTLGLNGASEMLVLLDGSADLSPADGLPGRAQKGQFVYDALRGAAMQSQAPVIAWLKAKGYEVTPFWIVNAILVKGDLALAREITALPGVHRVVGNPVVHALEDYSEGGSSSEVQPLPAGRHLAAASAARLRDPRSAVSGDPDRSSDGEDPGLISYAAATNTIVCGVVLIHANTVWTSKGVRGEGIVIANMDTGVDWTHPTLQTHYRGWNAGSPDHTYSWHDAIDHTTVPFDDGYHGTHTAGILVGDDGAGNQIGVAPGAKWIACRNMDHGDGTPARYLECMQWGLAPYPQGANPFTAGRPDLGADITNNSWGCPPTEGCDPLTLQQGFDNLRAAGQMTVVSAGNAGFSGCATVKDPPSLYDSVFTQGSVTCGGDLSSFSSRGPVTIDGSNRLKPNTVAPGTSILSAEPGGGYQTLSGTSMASPHTAGAMALLWSAKPNLKRLIRISRCYMEQSAGTVTGSSATCGGIPPSTRPNNLWGWGLINALAAIDLGPDTDSDGIADACDCAAGNGGAFEAPPEVGGDVFSNNKITATWQPLSALAGTGTQYDVVRGLVSNLRLAQDFSGAACFSENHAVANISDPQLPPVGDVFYYLERGQNTCGTGTYGNGKEGNPRNITACN